MLILMLFLAGFCCGDCRNAYLDEVLEDHGSLKHYIVVKAKVKDVENEIVVQNLNLYKFLKEKDKSLSDMDQYKAFVKNKIFNNNIFILTKKDLKQLKTAFVRSDSAVAEWARKGEKVFISHYFDVWERLNYARLKENVPPSSIPSIMKVLFNWNYLMSTVEGRLNIDQLDFCAKNIVSN